jgi:tartrate dehydratase beta subunit/fumarate hydratase class I family protein
MNGRTEVHYEHAFGPETTAAMATALEQVCEALRINGDATAREVIAERIIELARRGEHDPTKLRDRVLDEANGASLSWRQR